MSNSTPQVRRRPTKLMSRAGPDSNIVRASVLEAALELGIAHNSTVANWIFNNPLAEESEELDYIPPEPEPEGTSTPALTFASNITSDDSSSLSSPQNNVASASQMHTHTHNQSVSEVTHVHFNDFSSEQLTLSLPVATQPSTPIKGREMPGKTSPGMLSNVILVKSDAGYGSDGQYLSDSAGLKKSGKAKGKGKKGKPPALDLRSDHEREPGYSSDGGYLSASSSKSQKPSKGKSRTMAFFRRKPKKSLQASDDENDNIPPVPVMPPMPVPSSPRPLKHLGASSSPTRSGFNPLALSFNTSRPGSSTGFHKKDRLTPPPARVVSPFPTPSVPQPSEQTVNFKTSPSSLPPPTPVRSVPPTTVHTPSPMTPHSAPSALQAPGTPTRSSPHFPFRHIGIRPAPPPPTQPLPLPPSPPVPATPSRRTPGPPPPLQALPPLPAPATSVRPSTPTTPSRRMPPFRPLPVAPVPVIPPHPMHIPPSVPRGSSPAPLHPMSPLRPQPQHTSSDSVVPQRMHANGKSGPRRYQSHSIVNSDESFESGSSKNGAPSKQYPETPPLFIQRRMHGAQGFPRHPPPDSPLPQVPDGRYPHPAVSPSKFHEHFSSVSSTGHGPVALLSPRSASGSGSSSGPSVRSMRSSTAPSVSTSDSHGRSSHHSGGVVERRPETRTSLRSEISSGKQTTASVAREYSQLSILDTRSDVSASVYDEMSSVYDGETGNDPKGAQADDEDDGHDDDASFYPSDEKTAGRRTMYLIENGHTLDGDIEEPFPSSSATSGGGILLTDFSLGYLCGYRLPFD